VLEMCNRAIWIEQGRMVMDGDAADTMAAYLEYMASPDRTLPIAPVKKSGPAVLGDPTLQAQR
jgi:hypothetical protein